jgi:hypothetical protein
MITDQEPTQQRTKLVEAGRNTVFGTGETIVGPHSEKRQIEAARNTVLGAGDTAMGQAPEKAKVRFPRPLVVVPVLPDGAPDWEHRAVGIPLDLSSDGEMEFCWENAPELQTTAMIALVQEAAGGNRAIGIDVTSMRHLEKGAIKVVGRTGGFAEEILNPANLMPSFDAETLTFKLGFAQDMLDQWAAIGAMEHVFVDKVRVCCKCNGLLTYRSGCPNCGSSRLDNDQLIHHFACAHVGLTSDFEKGNDLVCPKCRVRHLIVAADFDYVIGPYHCLDCQWSNLEPEEVAQCLSCRFRFPAYQANTRDLRGYRANRLNPLTYLPSS